VLGTPSHNLCKITCVHVLPIGHTQSSPQQLAVEGHFHGGHHLRPLPHIVHLAAVSCEWCLPLGNNSFHALRLQPKLALVLLHCVTEVHCSSLWWANFAHSVPEPKQQCSLRWPPGAHSENMCQMHWDPLGLIGAQTGFH